MSHSFLFELGTEELPPVQLRGLRDALVTGITRALDDNHLAYGEVDGFATPRRLALLVQDLASAQPDTENERRGPKVDVAFNADGEPTKAALGFAGSCGVEVSDLERLSTDRGEWLMFRKAKPGRPARELLPELVNEVIGRLSTERMMRWGSTRTEFVRPAQWLVMLMDDEVIPATVLGQSSGRETRGHRFMSAGSSEIAHANDYVMVLKSLNVIASQDDRVKIIEAQLQEAVGDDVLNENVGLLDEVAALTEWPVVLRGDFPKQFLRLPDEVIISVMEKHQRYFALKGVDGQLVSSFLMVANLESKDPLQVIAGNERVIHPRLADGEFFWQADTQMRLEDQVSRLGSLVFQAKLGSYEEKTNRIVEIASALAAQLDADEMTTARAARLCKADLISEMVIEFSELQGIMGGHYARHGGESEAVAQAITEHYRPVGSGSALPETVEGCCVAIADKVDNLVGLFGIGEPPSGSRDPFGLRRASIGIIRIILERQLDLPVSVILASARAAHGDQHETDEVLEYLQERLRHHFIDSGVEADVVYAAFGAEAGIESMVDTGARVKALNDFRSSSAGIAATASNKRVSNILSKAQVSGAVDASLFEDAAETALAEQLTLAQDEISAAPGFSERLTILAGLQPHLDQFFDDVIVMTEDEALRNNRLALLQSAREMFLTVGDLSELQG